MKKNVGIGRSLQPLNLNVPADGMPGNPRDGNWGHSLTERVGSQPIDVDQQSLNDREEANDHGRDDSAQNSNGKINSDRFSNKHGSDSRADDEEDDDEDNDDDDTGSLDSIDKLQNILNEINDQCIENLKNEETDQALENLKRAE